MKNFKIAIRSKLFKLRVRQSFVNRFSCLIPYLKSSKAAKRILFISQASPIAQTQLFPFFFYDKALSKQPITLRELPLNRFKSNHHPYHGHVDIIFLQTWFDYTHDEMDNLVTSIKQKWPQAKLVYADWFANTDLRYAEVLDKHIDAYLKKTILKDFNQYSRPTLGHTMLTDYYNRSFCLEDKEFYFKVPENFQKKLFVGSSFVFARYLVPMFLSPFPENENRRVDIHARMAVSGTPWYQGMRQECFDIVQNCAAKSKLVTQDRVSIDVFLHELLDAKICFSPFGYGEVCWRDFEAICTGSLLFKQDMSHVISSPDIFIPYETYVPLAWDLSDFDEKVAYYLTNTAERMRIAHNAFDRLHNYFIKDEFLQDMRPFLERLGL